MALRARITAEQHAELEKAVGGLYVASDDGKFFNLDIDGVEDHPAATALKNALDRQSKERKEARAKADKLEADLAKFKGVDPEKYADALKKLEELDDKQLIDSGKIDELVEQKTERMRQEFQAQLEAKDTAIGELTEGRNKLTGQLEEVTIYTAITDAAIKAGARKEAMDDIKNRARPLWRLKDGKPTAFKPGTDDEHVFDKKGEPITIGAWIEDLAAGAPHLFTASGGGGAGGDKTGAGGNSGSIRKISPADKGKYLDEIAEGKAEVVYD